MKRKLMRAAFLFLLAAALCCVTAMAEGEDKGIYNKVEETGVTITPQTSDKKDISVGTVPEGSNIAGDFYPGAERVKVTYSSATSNNEYVVFLLKGDGSTPTASNIAYINQVSADGSTVTFDVYPNSLTSGETYKVYISGTGMNLTQVGSFQYYAPYTLGDVDNNGKIAAEDSLFALQITVGVGTWTDTQKKAADVDGKEGVDSTDALYILQKTVGIQVF